MSTNDPQPGADQPPIVPRRPDQPHPDSGQDPTPRPGQDMPPSGQEPGDPEPGKAYGQPEGNPYAQQPGQPEGNPYAQQPGQPEGNPYAQQPGQPEGNPYAQQPYGQQGGPEGPAGGAPAKKKFGVRQIISLIVVAVLLIGAGLFLWQRASEDSALQVGNCVVITKKGTKDHDIKKVDCGGEEASAQVVKVLDGETQCDEPYASFQYLNEKTNKVQKSYCLMEDLQPDKCYVEAKDRLPGVKLSECTDPNAFKITKRVDNSDDVGVCAPDEGVGFPIEPKRVYCVAAPS